MGVSEYICVGGVSDLRVWCVCVRERERVQTNKTIINQHIIWIIHLDNPIIALTQPSLTLPEPQPTLLILTLATTLAPTLTLTLTLTLTPILTLTLALTLTLTLTQPYLFLLLFALNLPV